MLLRQRPCADKGCYQLQGSGSCKSEPLLPWFHSGLTILNLNMHGFMAHKAELEVHLESMSFPALVGITETFLDTSVQHISLSSYTVISRLDRRSGRKGGGIALFARDDISHCIVHVGDSASHERSWHIIHSDSGPLLIELWY